MTTKVSLKPKSKEATQRREVEESEMRARFLIADITSLLGRAPEAVLTEMNGHLERALQSVRSTIETKYREAMEKLR